MHYNRVNYEKMLESVLQSWNLDCTRVCRPQESTGQMKMVTNVIIRQWFIAQVAHYAIAEYSLTSDIFKGSVVSKILQRFSASSRMLTRHFSRVNSRVIHAWHKRVIHVFAAISNMWFKNSFLIIDYKVGKAW